MHFAGRFSRARGSSTSDLLVGAGGSVAVAALQRLLSLGASVLLARVLAPSGYGVYSFAMSLVILLSIPAQFGMGPLLTREIAAFEASGSWTLFRGILKRGWQVTTLGVGLVSLIALGSLWLLPLGISYGSRITITLALGFMISNAFQGLAGAVLMGLRRVVVGQLPGRVLRPAVFLAAVFAVWKSSGGRLSPPLAMALNAAAVLAALGVTIWLVARSLPTAVTCGAERTFETRRWLGSALPFALVNGLWLVNAQADVVMVGLFRTSHDVGIYRVAVSGAALLSMVLGAVNTAIGPTVSRLHSQGNRVRLIRIVCSAAWAGLAGGTVTLLVFLLWGRPILDVVFGSAYLAAWLPLVILAAGQLVNAAVGPVGLVLNMTGHERDTVRGLTASAGANVALNALLIPLLGLDGAAIATGLSTMLCNGLLAALVYRRFGFLPLGLGRSDVALGA